MRSYKIKGFLFLAWFLSFACSKPKDQEIIHSSNKELKKELSVVFKKTEGKVSFEIKRNQDPYSGLYPVGWGSLKEKDFSLTEESCKKEIQKNLSGIVSQKPEIELNEMNFFIVGDDSVGVIDPQISLKRTKLKKIIKFDNKITQTRVVSNQLYVLSGESLFRVDENLSNIKVFSVNKKAESFGSIKADFWVKSNGKYSIYSPEGKVKFEIKTGKNSLLFGETEVLKISDDRISTVDLSGKESGSIKISGIKGGSYLSSLDGFFLFSDREIFVKSRNGLTKLEGVNKAQGNVKSLEDKENNILYLAIKDKKDSSSVVAIDTSVLKVIGSVNGFESINELSKSDDYIYIKEARTNTFVLLNRLKKNSKYNFDFSPLRIQAGVIDSDPSEDSHVFSPVSGETSMFILNDKDKKIYYYKEGMMAPVGSSPSYGLELKAGYVIKNYLKEKKVGVYETSVDVPKTGKYLISLLMKDQSSFYCKTVDLEASNFNIKEKKFGDLLPGFDTNSLIKINKKNKLSFKFKGNFEPPQTVNAHIFRIPTGEREKIELDINSVGEYVLEYSPKQNGHYRVIFESKGLIFNETNPIYLKVF